MPVRSLRESVRVDLELNLGLECSGGGIGPQGWNWGRYVMWV
jgi:hypothetical protein